MASSPKRGNKKNDKNKNNANNSNKILNYVQRSNNAFKTKKIDQNEQFSVADSEFINISANLATPNIISQQDLQQSLNSIAESGDVNKMVSIMVNAFTSITKAIESSHENSIKIAQTLDESTKSFQSISDQLNDKVESLKQRHEDYKKSNDNELQQLKVKSDLRYFKTQMIIYLKNDNILKTSQDNSEAVAKKIITDQGLSLGRAYITKAIILSGMKRINNVNKFTNYLYIHFSDSFTSERLIMEMIKLNKQKNGNPDVIFSQPSSYDISKLRRICNDLKIDGSVSKVFLGDDSIKVTLNKINPDDPNEKPKKTHIRNFADIDKLRKDVASKNFHIPSKTYFNSQYWLKKDDDVKNNRRPMNNVIVKEKRKTDEEIHPEYDRHQADTSTEKKKKNKKQRKNSEDIPELHTEAMDANDSDSSSFNSASEIDN